MEQRQALILHIEESVLITRDDLYNYMVSKSRLADHQGCYGGVWARRALGISARLQCGPCPSPATCIQFLGGGGGHAGDGNPLPSQALLLRGPTVEDTAGLPEASQSWKGESLPHNVALRL